VTGGIAGRVTAAPARRLRDLTRAELTPRPVRNAVSGCRLPPARRLPAARGRRHRLAGQRAFPGDDDELTGGLADGEEDGIGRLQDPQDVGYLLAAVPGGTAPADHDTTPHVTIGQPDLEAVTHRLTRSPAIRARRRLRRSRQVILVVCAGQPRGQPVDRDVELGMEVDERLQSRCPPGERHLVVARRPASSSIPRSVKYTPTSWNLQISGITCAIAYPVRLAGRAVAAEPVVCPARFILEP
jgi:hypothetical protein